MPKHRCAPLGGMLLQDLGEIQLYVWPKVGLAQADAQNTDVDDCCQDPTRKCGP